MINLTKRQSISVSIVIAGIGIFYFLTIREGQQWGDFSQYIQHAKNIVEGKSYGDTGYIFNPSVPCASNFYPPVFPLLLSPVYRLFGFNLTIMKVGMIGLFMASLVAIYFLFKPEAPFLYVILVIGLTGFNPFFWNFKETIVSDIPFLLFSFMCLCTLTVSYRSRDFRLSRAFLGALLLYLAFGTRTLGIILLFALIVYDMIQYRRPSSFLLKIIGIFAVFVALQQFVFRGFPNYSSEFFFSFKSMARNSMAYGRFLALFWHNGYSGVCTIALFLCLLGLAMLGYVKKVREDLSISEIYVFVYGLALVIWPPHGERYLMPVIPLFLLYVFLGVDRIGDRPVIKRGVFYVIVSAICLSYIGKYTTKDFGCIDGVTNRECIEFFEHVRQEIDSTDIVIFNRPRDLFLYTGRKSAVFPLDKSREKDVFDYFESISADYIVVGAERLTIDLGTGEAKAFGPDQEHVIPFIRRYSSRFRLTYRNKGFSIYEIIPR
jgi:4-amino-4-deoxy-L-arabinose transferase-like glycosyltransferase